MTRNSRPVIRRTGTRPAAFVPSWLFALATALPVQGADTPPAHPHGRSKMEEPGDGMADMAGHMHLTALRTAKPGDQDYHRALADGYEIFLPDVAQAQYHFTRYDYALAARKALDPAKPTSLLYTKTVGGGYRLVGAKHTARVDATEEELERRIPLSIARWHQHTNFCKAPAGRKAEYFGPDARFGLRGSITTREACDAAGGQFCPHLFDWMVHAYPYEKDPQAVWSIDDDDPGHDKLHAADLPALQER